LKTANGNKSAGGAGVKNHFARDGAAVFSRKAWTSGTAINIATPLPPPGQYTTGRRRHVFGTSQPL